MRRLLCAASFVLMITVAGCQQGPPSYPFRGSWVDLGTEGFGLVLEPNGDARARGSLPEDFICSQGEPLWVAGEGHWEADSDGRVQLYLGSDATTPIPVDAQMPFGEPSWTTVFVGVCGSGSRAHEFIQLDGKVSSS